MREDLHDLTWVSNIRGALGWQGRVVVHDTEDIQHLLTTCVFARQFWFNILQPLNLSRLAPRHTANSFVDWWRKSWKKLQKHLRKGVQFTCDPGCLDYLETQKCLCL